MGFPVGMQLATIAFGIPLTVTGKEVRTTVRVRPTSRVIWAATGQPLPEFEDSFSAEAGQLGQFQIPFVDQPGFIDSAGNTVTDFAYRIEASWEFGTERPIKWDKNLKPLLGQSGPIDLDLVPDGPVSIPVTAPTASVLGFNGRTGFITLTDADLPQRLSPEELSATYVGPRGKIITGPAAPAPALNVKDFGAKGDGVTDDVAAIRAAGAAGNHLYFPPGNYNVSSVADSAALLTFTGQDGVIVDAAEATLTNNTEYTADTITPMFKLDACKNVTIRLKKYNGFTLATPATHLGYRGASLVQAINGTDGVKIEAQITNARYGVVSGTYATPSAGYCKNFDIKLRTSFCGYPIAMYLAEGVRFDIDADASHRPVYLAGCNDVTGVARWKDLYIAPIAVLVTDALTGGTDAAAQADPVASPTSSRASSNIDVLSIDKGSTVFSAETYCIGLSLSRVDPMTYRNIRLRFSLAATNTLSTTVHGFIINSSAKSIWNRYPYNWEPHVVLENVRVSGTVDKSATTVSGGAQGPFTVRAYDTDATHAGTVRGLLLEDMTIRQGTVALAAAQLLARGAVTPIRLRGVSCTAAWIVVDTSATVPTVLAACNLLTVDVSPITGGSRIILAEGTTVTAINGTTTRVEMQGGSIRGAGPVIKTKELTATLTGASVSLAGAIPAGCLLLGVQGRITTAITGASGYQVGITGDLTRWVNRDDTAAGSLFGINTYAAAEVSPRYYPSNPDIIITARTASFTGGALRILLSYVEFPALAS